MPRFRQESSGHLPLKKNNSKVAGRLLHNRAMTLFVSILTTQKPPLSERFSKWCAILCDYRTNYAQEYREQGYKIEKVLENI